MGSVTLSRSDFKITLKGIGLKLTVLVFEENKHLIKTGLFPFSKKAKRYSNQAIVL